MSARLVATRLDYVGPDTCVGYSAIGWNGYGDPPHCGVHPKFTAGGWPACGQHVGWLLRVLMEHGHYRISVEPMGGP